MPRSHEPGGHDLVREWKAAMQSLASAASSVAGHAPVPQQLLAPMQRQLELVQEILERERRLQQELLTRTFAPLDAVFDLLEQSGATIRQQAEALQQAAHALQETAVLMKAQAELFERGIKTIREPADLARSVAGLEKRPAKKKAAPRKKS